jgi:hypothetical protein
MQLIEGTMLQNFVRYERLSKLVFQAYSRNASKHIRVYVDLYSLFLKLYDDDRYYVRNDNVIASYVINMVGHYREFFRRLDVSSEFWLVHSSNLSTVKNGLLTLAERYASVKGGSTVYNQNAMNKYKSNPNILRLVGENLNILSLISPYIPDVHFVQDEDHDSVEIIGTLVAYHKKKSPDPCMIITRDPFMYQLTHTDVIVLRPKKDLQGTDVSYYVDHGTIIPAYTSERRLANRDRFVGMSPDLMNLIYVLGSVPERGLSGMFNITAVSTIIKELLRNHIVLNGYNSFEDFVGNTVLSDTANYICHMGYQIHPKYIHARNSVTDIRFNIELLINTSYTVTISKPNLYDPKGVREVNDLYFQDYPLDLSKL